MKSFKLVIVLVCIVLLSEQSSAVLNKNRKNVNNDSSGGESKSENSADDRISNEYGVPRPNGPAPVYGPPELTGNHAPVQIFPPPPAELPPPPPPSLPPLSLARPHSAYGPARKPPQFGGPRPFKLAPWKQLAGSSSRFHGSPIALSLESYGPPANLASASFSAPRPDYGAPLALPPPGVPAPPTPPDIKYDGWQPIAGHVDSPSGNLAPVSNNFDHSASVNLPSNSYGEPINNPEDHNLKQSSVDQLEQGLPPPQLPDTEILHNIQEPADSLPPHQHGQQHSNSFESLPTASSNLASSSSSFSSDTSSGYESAHGNGHSQDLSVQLAPPGPTSVVSDSYGIPPPASSFPSGGPYVSSNFPFRQQYRHHLPFSFFRQRGHNTFRPHGLPGTLIPPRSRAPMKFRESVPTGLLNSISHYLPPPQVIPSGPIKPASTYGQPPRFGGFSLQQQLPNLKQSVSFHSAGSYEKSPLAAANVNYGTPLTFTSFNTPAPVLTYGAPNFGPTGYFISSSNVAGGNLYDQHTLLSTSYGSPQVFNDQHDCTGFQQHKPIEPAIQLSTLQLQNQANLDSSSPIAGAYSVPPINQLELELPHINQQSEIKDSYGNPTGAGAGIYDQRSASSTVTNFKSETLVNSGGTAEALTAALTAQGYASQSNQDNYNDQQGPTDNSYNQGTNSVASTADTLNVEQLSQLHADSEPALALAQTLSAEGASSDGFQIQGSKGTYSLQIQSANGLRHNSDGSIRHDQLLSDGLLQDILAAIEQPNGGNANHLVQIQGGPQAQQLAEIHQQAYESHDDLSHAASSSLVSSSRHKGIMNPEDVALFFNNNYGDKKEIRSTAKAEGNIDNIIKSTGEEANENKKKKKKSS